ncbi:MAG TPA: hypothetical protein VLV86_02445, partial [Vicinamibacterales bacterium]|nr:hypothetical protein [Vicinamibacterales bacterium]
MRVLFPYAIAFALLSTPSFARAQNPTNTPPPSQAPASPPASAPATASNTATSGPSWLNASSHWVAAGFIGSNFGSGASSASMDFGGEVGYLYRGILGGELLTDFAPNFNMNNAFLANTPTVNAYMLNLMAAAPFGGDYRFQPYVSGGFGAVQLRSTMLGSQVATTAGTTTTFTTGPNQPADDSRFGGDIGAGV